MMTLDTTWLTTLLASNALLAAAATVALLRFQRLQRRRPRQAAEAAAPQDGDIEQRMRRLERLASELSRRDDALSAAPRREAPYETAVRLVRLGAGADDVAGRCGLSRGEAELLTRLHGRRA